MVKRLVALAVLCIFPLALEAAKVKVHFTDNENKPLGEVQAKIVPPQSTEGQVKSANKKGDLNFDKVDAGDYQILAQKSGYMPLKSDVIKVAGADVELTLKLMNLEYFNKLETSANTALQQQDFKGALQHYQELLTLAPDNAVTWSNIAKASAMLNDWPKALEAGQKAAALDPGQFENFSKQLQSWATYSKGQQYLEQKDFPKAVEAFLKVVEADPNNAEALYGLALAYGHQKNYQEALKSIDQALKLKPNEAEFLAVQKIIKHNSELSSQK
jgi:tetratricopeptide (TPR) repeat protein